MTDPARPPIQATAPHPRRPKPREVRTDAAPKGWGAGRAEHGLKPHVDEAKPKI